MEKINHSSNGSTFSGGGGGGGSTSSNFGGGGGGGDKFFNLNHLNKASQKISKTNRRQQLNPLINDSNNLKSFQIPPPIPPPLQQQLQPLQQQQQQQHHHQPPVYNINKNDFRDVVQRLTGSPAHDRVSSSTSAPAPPPPPMVLSKPTSSRLQRIRPPPLAQISHRPPGVPQIGGNHLQGNVINSSGPFPNQIGFGSSSSSGSGQVFLGGQRQPLSPLPPFPSVHSAAESPVSAYMRYLQSSISSTTTTTNTNTAPSPRWGNALPPPTQQQLQLPAPPLQQQHQQNIPPPETQPTPTSFPSFPASPLPFGCLPSPNSQMGFQQLPISPTVPLPSPNKWRNI